MARADRHLRLSTVLVGSALALAVVAVYLFGWLEPLEDGLYDLRARECQHFTPKPTDKLVHVDIDDAALEAVGAWPWPRSLMAEMIDEMSAAGAKAIALDILYTEPQEKQWEPTGADNQFRLIDHDANLAASFKRAGNILLPASLLYVAPHSQTPALSAAVSLLTANLELSRDKLIAALQEKGFTAKDFAELDSVYFDLRREAARTRVERELTAAFIDRAVAATTQPATLPSSQPTSQPSTVMDSAARALDAVHSALRLSLFPSQDPSIASPEGKLVNEAYDQVQAARDLSRLGRSTVEGAPAFVARNQILPLPILADAAAATGFVDYPNLGDGTVRNVPLLMQFQGKLHLQLGFRVACQLLEVNPSDLVVTSTSITIPAGTLKNGAPRRAMTIPVRTGYHVTSTGKTVGIPMVMDIPWFGPNKWWAMYDPEHPELKKQHTSLSFIYDIVRTKRKIVAASSRVDQALLFLFAKGSTSTGIESMGLGLEWAKAYAARHISPDDTATRLAAIDFAFSQLQQSQLIEQCEAAAQDPRDRDAQAQNAELKIHVANLGAARLLGTQLSQQRGELAHLLNDKAAIIGWTAVASVADAKPTPLHPSAPGVVIHGVVANAILTGDLWRTLPAWATVVVALVLGLLTTIAVAWLSPVRSLAAALFLLTGYVLVNAYLLFDYGNLILDLATPSLAICGAWAGGTITRLVIEARERTRITRRFASYVDRDLVNYVLESRDETIFTGQRRETAVVFTDLEGFTKLTEEREEDVIGLLNDFMGRAVEVIKRHHGFVNKFLGDGILFFFNAPRPNTAFVSDAIDAILDLQKMMVTFNAELEAKKFPQLRLRAGVTTGKVIAGNAGSERGSEKRFDYTVLGPLVNLASRLESANKYFGTSNLITEETMHGAGERFVFRPVGIIKVVGVQKGVMVYESLGLAAAITPEQAAIAVHSRKMVDAMSAGNAADCLAAVTKLEAVAGKSKLTEAYRKRCEPFVNGQAEGEMERELVLTDK